MIFKSGNRFSEKIMREKQPSGAIVGSAFLNENLQRTYLAAEKRLSNEFDDTIGWAPATRLLAGC
jgi:hypothetical protein